MATIPSRVTWTIGAIVVGVSSFVGAPSTAQPVTTAPVARPVATAPLAQPVTGAPPAAKIAAVKMVATSGDRQTIVPPAGSPASTRVVFAPLAARLTTLAGEPLAGKTVTWSCDSPERTFRCTLGVLKGGAVAKVGVITNADGGITMPGVEARFADNKGDFTVTAKVNDGVPGTEEGTRVSFRLRVGPDRMRIVSGDNQTRNHPMRITTEDTFRNLTVQVTDAGGEPMADVPVTFTLVNWKGKGTSSLTNADGTWTGFGHMENFTKTGADGRAVLSALWVSWKGKPDLRAVSNGRTNEVAFDLTVR